MSEDVPPQERIQALVALFSKGDLQAAVDQSERLIARFPQGHQLYNIRAAALAGLGRTDEALESYRQSLQVKPDYAEAHSNLGATYYRLGRFQEAAESCRAALRIAPEHAAALGNLGAALVGLGSHSEAVAVLKRALSATPGNAELWNNLGAAQHALGHPEEAEANIRKALNLQPAHPGALQNLGACLAARGRHPEAIDAYRKALEIVPLSADAHFNLGNALGELGRRDEALTSFDRALALCPDHAEALNSRAAVLIRAGRYGAALESATAALALRPDFAEAMNSRGLALYLLGRFGEAVKVFETALAGSPESADVLVNLGNAMRDTGRRDAARRYFEQALAAQPGNTVAHLSLARLKTFGPGDPQIAQMQRLVAAPDVSDRDRVPLLFALGEASEDLDDIEAAFRYFIEGNKLRKSLVGYDSARDRALFARIKAAFASGLPPGSGASVAAGPGPIFIVGMPRSGTSLVEQILASHSRVHGGGELPYLNQAVQAEWRTPAIETATMQRIAESYRAKIAGIGVQADFVTDKMPHNFRWIGFIRHALPEAKIVVVRRDARAVCWSIFKHMFGAEAESYVNDLDDIAAFHKMYADQMAFWAGVFPGGFYDLDYDQLTENQETETRALLTYLGLPWEDRCLEFHKTERVVATTSATQVREKMYTGSSREWRRYEKFLQPLTDRLKGA